MKRKILSAIFLLVLSILVTYVYIGFYHLNEETLAKTKLIYKLIFIWGPRIGIPIVYGYIVYLVVWANKAARKTASYILVISLVILLVLFPIAQTLKSTLSPRKDKYADRFHPYLQLRPPIIGENKKYRPDNFNIFCLGGSTTQYKNTKGEGWPSMLEQELSMAIIDSNISVHNLGMQWYTTMHSLINYQANIKHFNHNVLIVMHNINDLLHNADFSTFSKGNFRHDYGHFYGPMKNAFKPTSNVFSSLFGTFGSYWYQEQDSVVNETNFPGLISFERNLNSIIDLAELYGVKVVLLTQPNILHSNISDEVKEKCQMINSEAVGNGKKWSYKTGVLGMRLYNEKIKSIAKERGLLLVDIEKVVPKDLKHFSDEVHYTDITFPIIAKEISNTLLNQKDYWYSRSYNTKALTSKIYLE